MLSAVWLGKAGELRGNLCELAARAPSWVGEHCSSLTCDRF